MRRSMVLGMTATAHRDLRGRTFFLMARANLQSGDREAATRLLDRAEEVGGRTRDTRLLRRELKR